MDELESTPEKLLSLVCKEGGVLLTPIQICQATIINQVVRSGMLMGHANTLWYYWYRKATPEDGLLDILTKGTGTDKYNAHAEALWGAVLHGNATADFEDAVSNYRNSRNVDNLEKDKVH